MERVNCLNRFQIIINFITNLLRQINSPVILLHILRIDVNLFCDKRLENLVENFNISPNIK